MDRRISAFLWYLVACGVASAAPILSPFAGSEALGEYATDFVRFHYLEQTEDGPAAKITEGRLISRLYRKPPEKSNYEVFRSYEKEIAAAGFELIAALGDNSRVELLARSINDKTANNFLQRNYQADGKSVGVGTKALVATQAQQYIAARKQVNGVDILIVVSTSRSGNYVIEQLESAAMEQETVQLTLENLNNRIDRDGRIAIYGINFDSNSAVIKAESANTIETIVSYLRQNPQRSFYVVGHTDDEGTLQHNMSLSHARAEAVVAAIVAALPQAESRLTAHGVGPLSPVATNTQADGRGLNRRVELVSTVR